MKKTLLLAGLFLLNGSLMAKGKYSSDDLTFKQAMTICDNKKDAQACMLAGAKAWNARDDKRAHHYNKKGCDLGNAQACSNLAYDYQKGYGTKKNKTLMKKYYKVASKLYQKDGNDGMYRYCKKLSK